MLDKAKMDEAWAKVEEAILLEQGFLKDPKNYGNIKKLTISVKLCQAAILELEALGFKPKPMSISEMKTANFKITYH